MKTPITYWGGKQQMIPIILPMIPEHRQYNEPFLGGGAIYFAKNPSEIEFINDINGEMVNFYRTLKLKFEELKQEVDCTLHSEYLHRKAKDIYAEPLNHNDVLRAWAVWMLSHQSIYAILTNGWSMSTERNMAKHVQWTYASRLERTSIFSRDAVNIIESVDTPTTFHYVDPPYFNSEMGHYGGYTEDDFRRLLNVLSEITGKFILSSYPSETLDEYVKKNGWITYQYEMHRSAGGGRKIEVLTLNYDPKMYRQLKIFDN